MEQSEKIKAGLCNFFSFIIEFENSKKIEFILVNYIQFNTWFNYLTDLVNNNIIRYFRITIKSILLAINFF